MTFRTAASTKSILRQLACVFAAASWILSASAAPLMRFPTASKTRIAFVAYGDLWTAPLQGGSAHRLIHVSGSISNSLYSPDGRWIAYTCQQGGLRDVYVISAQGGDPKRLTY